VREFIFRVVFTEVTMRTAFYPACARDFVEPTKLLATMADRIVFCDSDAWVKREFESARERMSASSSIMVTFIQADAWLVASRLPRIDVVFQRNDSFEGSCISILRKSFLRLMLSRMPHEGGHFVTDGSTTWGHEFRRLTRSDGVNRFGWHLGPAAEQLFQKQRLWVIRARPILAESAFRGLPPSRPVEVETG
jgi:hypothetical protein